MTLSDVKPYYSDSACTIYHGDCREVLPYLDPVDTIITDPVWPNADPQLFGSAEPCQMFASAAEFFPTVAPRVVVHLGCDSDPAILSPISQRYTFFRVCWLEYVRPNYKGRLLYTGDVAYVFGPPPKSRPGAHVLPGRCIQNDAARNKNGHPCARQLMHVQWLVGWFSEGTVLDPFCGSGTTLLAAKNAGRKAIGIEIEEKYCEISANRLAQEVLALDN